MNELRGEQRGRACKVARANKQQGEMIVGHLPDSGHLLCPQFTSLFQSGKSSRIVFAFELAQAEETPTGPQLWVQIDHLGECGARVGEVIAVVEKRSGIPPTFFPLGMKLQRLLVIADGFLSLALFARGGGLAGEILEVCGLAAEGVDLARKSLRERDQQKESNDGKLYAGRTASPLTHDRGT